MPVVPTPPTIRDGIVPSSTWNQFRDAINFLQLPPLAQLRQTSVQSLPNNTWTAITFNAEDVDTDVDGTGGHDTVTNNSRFTARYAGWYQLSGAAGFAANGTGLRGARWLVNGIALNAGGTVLPAGSGSFTVVPAAVEKVYMNIGDYVELQALQSSGGALDTAIASTVQSTMAVRWTSR